MEEEGRMKDTTINIIGWIFTLIVFIGCIVLMYYNLKDNGESTAKFCDDKYGVNNWYFKDITGTQEARDSAGRFYIGQVWVCVGYGGSNETP